MNADDERMSKNATILLYKRTIEKIEVQKKAGVLKIMFTDGGGCLLDAVGIPPTIYVKPLPR